MTRTSTARLLAAVLTVATLAPAGPLFAQANGPWFRQGSLLVSGELGGIAFTDFQRSTARSPADPELGDFQRRVSAQTTVTAGIGLTYWIRDGWGLRAGAAYAPSGFSVRNDARAQQVLDARTGDVREADASLAMWFADAALVFRLPASVGRVVPYGIAGGGIVEYRAGSNAELPPEARARFGGGRWRSAAAVFGVGAAFPLDRGGMLMSFELKNHVTRTPLDDDGRGEWFEFAGAPVQIERDPERGTDGIGLASNLRLTVGLSVPLRRAR
jgi:hypothetical protein